MPRRYVENFKRPISLKDAVGVLGRKLRQKLTRERRFELTNTMDLLKYPNLCGNCTHCDLILHSFGVGKGEGTLNVDCKIGRRPLDLVDNRLTMLLDGVEVECPSYQSRNSS